MLESNLLLGIFVSIVSVGGLTFFASKWLDKVERDIRLRKQVEKDLFVRALITFMVLSIIAISILLILTGIIGEVVGGFTWN